MTPQDSQQAPIRRYRDIVRSRPPWVRARLALREFSISATHRYGPANAPSSGIRFLFYHHVFEDEQLQFDRQLKFFRRHGDFLHVDQAVSLISEAKACRDRYFVVTFDDGMRCCYDFAAPTLVDNNASACFFVCPDFTSALNAQHSCLPMPGMKHFCEYMNWEECHNLLNGGMSIGCHTLAHARLANLSDAEVRADLLESKRRIESALGSECKHFACPWGRPGLDFRVGRDDQIARDIGFASFMTVTRGAMQPGDDPYFIRRDFLWAGWPESMIRHSLGL